MGGRPTSLTTETVKRICDRLEIGATKHAAAAKAGIGVSTFMGWQKRGRDEQQRRADGERGNPNETRFIDFLESIEVAELIAEDTLISKINDAASEHWQAAAWILERRHPEKYGRYTRSDVTSGGKQIASGTVVNVYQESGPEPPDVFPSDLGA